MDFKRKISSRKFWAAIVGVLIGLATIFGLDEGVISNVAGAVVSAASVIVYIITEGKIDAESVKIPVEGIQEGIEVIQDD